jgi:GxxExxY protein
MNTPASGLKRSALTDKIIDIFCGVYNQLGHGILESTYSEALAVALYESALTTAREVPVPVWFRDKKVGQYDAELMVEGVVPLELKAARTLDSAHQAKLLHYLRATEVEVGLLLNFGLRPQFRRLIFDNERKKIRENQCESAAQVSA